MRRDLSKDAELLVSRQENSVLRRQSSRVRCGTTCQVHADVIIRLSLTHA